MKAKIICFSQQGGTKAIAEDIAAGIRDAGDDCELADLTATDPSNPGDCDLIGIGCPVLFFKEPFNVADWESMMHLVPDIFENYFKNLDAAEKRGEFRRHIDRKAINLDDPIYKQMERELAARTGNKE